MHQKKLLFYKIACISAFFILINTFSYFKKTGITPKIKINQKNIIVEPDYKEYCIDPCNYKTMKVDTFVYKVSIENRSSEIIPRAITIIQHKQMMLLLEKMDTLFRRNNITYMLAYGSLIGSYRHHDVIPWDDDLDILLKSTDENKLIEIFKFESDLQLTPHSHYLKIFMNGTNRAGATYWNWPFVDLFVYKENISHISTYLDAAIPIDFVYPLRLRPFGSLFLPVPKDIFAFLNVSYSKLDENCFDAGYNHINEVFIKERSAECKILHGFYKFVNRECNKTHCMDHLLIDGVYIHTFIYKKIS